MTQEAIAATLYDSTLTSSTRDHDKVIFDSKIDTIARILILLGICFIPLSPTLDELTLYGAVLSLFGGQLKEKFKIMSSLKLFYATLALAVLFAIGTIHTQQGHLIGLKALYKYVRYFAVMLLLIPLFIETKWRERAVKTIIASAFIATFIYFSKILTFLPWSHLLSHIFKNILTTSDIQYSPFLAFFAFLLLNQMIDLKKRDWFKLGLFVVLIFELFFINLERTGMIVFLALMLLMSWQRWKIKGILLALASVLILAPILYFSSYIVHAKVNQSIEEIKSYKTHPESSGGNRIVFIKNGIAHIKQYPLLGTGTGGYTAGVDTWLETHTFDHIADAQVDPENVFIHVALQIGLIGLIVFILWLGMQWYDTMSVPLPERRWAQGLMVMLIVGGFCFLSFYQNRISFFYCSYLAIFLAARFDNSILKNKK